jgi:hypothetical protein
MNGRYLALIAASAMLFGGCAFVPKDYPRLDEARRLQDAAASDPRIEHLAATELARAREALELARTARDTLDDPAVVDHLAYVAKQRLAIAHYAAELRTAQATIASYSGRP